MNRIERAVWNAAVKRPHMTGYALWMQEAMYLMAQAKFAPDVPSISGGHNPRKALEGTKVRSCPPPGPPPAFLLTQVGVRGIYSTDGSWKFFVEFHVNFGSTVLEKLDSIVMFWFGWHWWPWPDGSYSWWTNQCKYNANENLWCDIWPPFPCLEGSRTQESEIPKTDEKKGGFIMAGPNCETQSGDFYEDHDWYWTPP